MSEKEIKELSAAMKKFAVKLSKDKKAAKAFLVEVGIITPRGNLRKPYRHLCIQRVQD
jgi:hypothetical protein